MTGYEFGQPYATFQLAPNQGLRGWPVLGKTGVGHVAPPLSLGPGTD